MLAWKNDILPWKVIENLWKSLKNINFKKLDIFVHDYHVYFDNNL